MIENNYLEQAKDRALGAKFAFPEFHKSTAGGNVYCAFLSQEQLDRYKQLVDLESQDIVNLVEEVKILQEENNDLKAQLNSVSLPIESWVSDNHIFEIQKCNGVYTLFALASDTWEPTMWIGEEFELTELQELAKKVLETDARKVTGDTPCTGTTESSEP